ncbi:Chromate resistance protein ChrB [Spirillospora sp. NPDC046719]
MCQPNRYSSRGWRCWYGCLPDHRGTGWPCGGNCAGSERCRWDRTADWTEFLDDCDKYEAELAKEIRTAKFTLAKLEEEERSLERLRRWHRDLTARDVFGSPQASQAAERLKQCAAACEDYAERVFAVLHQSPEGGG